MINFPCSLTINITLYSMKSLAFHSLYRWKMIILPILTTSLMHTYSLWKDGSMYFLNLPRVINFKFALLSLTRNITLHSMKKLAFHRLLKWKITTLTHPKKQNFTPGTWTEFPGLILADKDAQCSRFPGNLSGGDDKRFWQYTRWIMFGAYSSLTTYSQG